MEPLTPEEKDKFKSILVDIYGNQATRWNVNKKVLELLGKMIDSSDYCSRYMDKVPRPHAFSNVKGWASRQFRHAFLRKVSNADRQYFICFRTAGLKYKTDFILAANSP